MRIVLTESADADLAGITRYTLDRFGEVQADRYISGLAAFLEELPDRRYRLKPVRTTVGQIRRAVYRSHVAFVRETEDAMIVLRILHDKMDPSNYLPIA